MCQTLSPFPSRRSHCVRTYVQRETGEGGRNEVINCLSIQSENQGNHHPPLPEHEEEGPSFPPLSPLPFSLLSPPLFSFPREPTDRKAFSPFPPPSHPPINPHNCKAPPLSPSPPSAAQASLKPLREGGKGGDRKYTCLSTLPASARGKKGGPARGLRYCSLICPNDGAAPSPFHCQNVVHPSLIHAHSPWGGQAAFLISFGRHSQTAIGRERLSIPVFCAVWSR